MNFITTNFHLGACDLQKLYAGTSYIFATTQGEVIILSVIYFIELWLCPAAVQCVTVQTAAGPAAHACSGPGCIL